MVLGASPAYITVAGAPPMDIWKPGSELLSLTIWPAGILGVTGPHPTPYRGTISPGVPRREVMPATSPGGIAYVAPSENSAPTYWNPPTLNDGGANMPGCSALTITVVV